MGILSKEQIQKIRAKAPKPESKAATLPQHGEQRAFKLSELSRWWGWSDDTRRRHFINEPGVGKIIHPERFGNSAAKDEDKKPKRQYVSLRIPLPIAQQVYARLFPGSSTWMPPGDGPIT